MSRPRNSPTARRILQYVEHCEARGYPPLRREVAYLFNDSGRGYRHAQNIVNNLLAEGRLSVLDSADGYQRLITPTLIPHAA